MQQPEGHEGRQPGAHLELRLLRQRLDPSCARTDAHSWLRARAQPDTGVGKFYGVPTTLIEK